MIITVLAVLGGLCACLVLVAWLDRHEPMADGNPRPPGATWNTKRRAWEARPSREEMLVAAYMADKIDVFDFVLAVDGVIDPLVSDGTCPFVVGGTDAPGGIFWQARDSVELHGLEIAARRQRAAGQRYVRSIKPSDAAHSARAVPGIKVSDRAFDEIAGEIDVSHLAALTRSGSSSRLQP